MNPWAVLGIAPSRDRKRIRKAYAARLKHTHPEDDPDGFQKLRQAYEMVLGFLDAADHRSIPVLHSPPPEPEVEKTVPRSRTSAPSALPGEIGAAVVGVFDRARALSESEPSDPEEAWRSVLEDDALWGLDARARFESALFAHLARSKAKLDPPIWILLEKEFHWREQGLSLYRRGIDRPSVDHVLESIHDAFSWKSVAALRDREMFTLIESGVAPPEEERTVFWTVRELIADFWPVALLGLALVMMSFMNSAPVDRSVAGAPRASSPGPIERFSAAAAATLADQYQLGDGVEQDMERAVSLHRGAAEGGHAYSQRRLGDAYREGWVETDFDKALAWYRHAAEQNDAMSEYWLGRMHFDGMGTTEDDATGFVWMRRAAERGHALAQSWVGLCYERGRGVARDRVRALSWYRRAAEADEAWAQLQLGRIYLTGTGGDLDYDEGLFWISLAARDPNLGPEIERWRAPTLEMLDDERRQALERRLEQWTPRTP